MNKFLRNTDKGVENKWLTTFNDMVTLLMVFFVLLFAMSTVDVKKLHTASHSLRSGLGVLQSGEETTVDIADKIEKERIEESVRKLEAEPGVASFETKMGIVLTLDDRILFKSGKADIQPEGLAVLDKVIDDVIVNIDGPVRVEGHTDSVPIRYNTKYPSNWELSIARAVNVVKYFVETEKVAPEKLSAVGYGESKPLVPNDTPENRAKNRRVEIVLVTDGGI